MLRVEVHQSLLPALSVLFLALCVGSEREVTDAGLTDR